MESGCDLVKMFGTDPNKILLKANFFFDINLKFETQLVQSVGFDFLAVLEPTRFSKYE